MLTFRRSKGQWVVYGPAAEVHIGSNNVTTKSGAVRAVHVVSRSKVFGEDFGEGYCYGYIMAKDAQGEDAPEVEQPKVVSKSTAPASMPLEVVAEYMGERDRLVMTLTDDVSYMTEHAYDTLKARLVEVCSGLGQACPNLPSYPLLAPAPSKPVVAPTVMPASMYDMSYAAPTMSAPVKNDPVDPMCLRPIGRASKLSNPCFLTYDIPSSSKAANPSAVLRRVAVRVNLSVWCIPEDRIPYKLLNELQQAGATCHVIRFADSEVERLVEMAASCLKRDMDAAQQSLQDSIANADADAEEDATSEDAKVRAGTRKRYVARVKSAIKAAEKAAADYRNAASVFGVDEGRLSIEAGATALAAVKKAWQQKAAAYALMAQQAKVIAAVPGASAEAQGIAAAAAADEIPSEVLADWLQDQE